MSEANDKDTNKTGYVDPEKVEDTKDSVESSEAKFDDFGYEVSEDKPKEEDIKKPDSEEPKKDEDIKDPATGYGDDEPKEVEEGEDKKPEDKEKVEEKEQPAETDLGDTEGLLEHEIKDIKEFAVKNKLSAEVTKALVAHKKNEVKRYSQLLKDRDEKSKKAQVEIKKQWYKELKEDKVFGGENFKVNVAKVEKMVDQFLPGIKKELTKTGVMLPPYIMKDFHNLSKHLYSSESFVQGDDPVNEEKNSKKGDDPLDFYNS